MNLANTKKTDNSIVGFFVLINRQTLYLLKENCIVN